MNFPITPSEAAAVKYGRGQKSWNVPFRSCPELSVSTETDDSVQLRPGTSSVSGPLVVKNHDPQVSVS